MLHVSPVEVRLTADLLALHLSRQGNWSLAEGSQGSVQGPGKLTAQSFLLDENGGNDIHLSWRSGFQLNHYTQKCPRYPPLPPSPALERHKDPETGPNKAPRLRTLLPVGKEGRLKSELGSWGWSYPSKGIEVPSGTTLLLQGNRERGGNTPTLGAQCVAYRRCSKI